MDLTGLQQNDKPTRDVLVVFDDSGDREFVGFGSAKNGEFADCFLEAGKLPHEAIQVCADGFALLAAILLMTGRDKHREASAGFCRPCHCMCTCVLSVCCALWHLRSVSSSLASRCQSAVMLCEWCPYGL